MSRTYRLTRRLSDGTIKPHVTVFKRPRDAAQAAFFVLYDNRADDKKGATAFASRLQDAPIGTWLDHESGYSFMIDIRKEA